MEESTVDNYAFSNLKEKLDSADSLKEYIIISEILGKPKYFRR